MVPFLNGAAGVVSSAKLFRPEDFAELTTPSAASSVASRLYLVPQPPLLCEEGNTPHSTFLHFVHISYDRPHLVDSGRTGAHFLMLRYRASPSAPTAAA